LPEGLPEPRAERPARQERRCRREGEGAPHPGQNYHGKGPRCHRPFRRPDRKLGGRWSSISAWGCKKSLALFPHENNMKTKRGRIEGEIFCKKSAFIHYSKWQTCLNFVCASKKAPGLKKREMDEKIAVIKLNF